MHLPGQDRNQRGFTLMEVIVTIMAAGILAAFFVHFMGTSLTGASESVARVQAESSGGGAMERIIADYVAAMNGNAPGDALDTITGKIDDDNYDNANLGIDVSYDYIQFNSGAEEIIPSPGTSNTLKITVAGPGYSHVFLLGQTRTADEQPLVYF